MRAQAEREAEHQRSLLAEARASADDALAKLDAERQRAAYDEEQRADTDREVRELREMAEELQRALRNA